MGSILGLSEAALVLISYHLVDLAFFGVSGGRLDDMARFFLQPRRYFRVEQVLNIFCHANIRHLGVNLVVQWVTFLLIPDLPMWYLITFFCGLVFADVWFVLFPHADNPQLGSSTASFSTATFSVCNFLMRQLPQLIRTVRSSSAVLERQVLLHSSSAVLLLVVNGAVIIYDDYRRNGRVVHLVGALTGLATFLVFFFLFL